jgi:hypothetical protein
MNPPPPTAVDLDPEENLNFKLKRVQFNNRIPIQLSNLFDEFGESKRFLLEYLMWMACKHLGTQFTGMKEWEASMLEQYFESVKGLLRANKQFGPEFAMFTGLEADLEARLKQALAQKARSLIESEDGKLDQDE